MAEPPKTAFEEAGDQQRRPGFLSEFWQFLKHNKKWWLLPIVVALLLFALLLWLSSTAAAPFIYTLF
jgi:drug/metabolite transporter superfamily protein YnfA